MIEDYIQATSRQRLERTACIFSRLLVHYKHSRRKDAPPAWRVENISLRLGIGFGH